jgi:hypothetical protein
MDDSFAIAEKELDSMMFAAFVILGVFVVGLVVGFAIGYSI